MLSRNKDIRRILLLLPLGGLVGGLVGVSGCTVGGVPIEGVDAGSSSSSSSSGGDLGPCGQDCSLIETPPCTVAVCNTGQVLGPLNTCIVVPAAKGTPCDDGKFCTLNDICDEGVCTGGTIQNNCGIKPDPCSSVICYEELKSCDTIPVSDGSPCTPTNLCEINGVCKIGKCIGEPKDCTFSPLNECNKVTCEPATGKCVGAADPLKNNTPCVLTGDLCNINKVCLDGQCLGGEPKDCSSLDSGCRVGACNPNTGLCSIAPAPPGKSCTEGIAECQVGACDDKGACVSSVAADSSPCNDYDACTQEDKCAAGTCLAGSPIASCSVYLHDGFEVCPSGWTFGGDWECGQPTNVGPESAHLGSGAIGTNIDGLYTVNQGYNTAVATSPVIDLTMATSPRVSFWAWDHTEGGIFDGWNLKISTDGGQTFTQVTTVTPAYNLTIASQPAWGGDKSALGWQNYQADLSAYVGKTAQLRFSFRSDGATVYPGVYVDEVVVAEPMQVPIYIMTNSPLEDVYSGMSYLVPINRIGGSSSAVWSIKPGGQNTGWLTIDPMTGELHGTPTAADVGPVTVTVRVEEPMLPSNFAERTFSFSVKANAYYTSFEGMCPNGWTLTGDWQCGIPANVGPATAYIGKQCLATQLTSVYSNLQAWTTATSPEIDLTSSPGPLMTFRMWIETEGSTYDGVNLQVSTDGGMTYSVVTAVSPPYPLTIAGQPAWGGQLAALGWQFMQADLSAYAGQKIFLRFAFRSDSSGTFPGIYIDDIFID